MTRSELFKYLRISETKYYSLTKSDWQDMPKEKIKYLILGKDGKKHGGLRYNFDIKKIIDYLEKKFNG
jgi:hypothetical protein